LTSIALGCLYKIRLLSPADPPWRNCSADDALNPALPIRTSNGCATWSRNGHRFGTPVPEIYLLDNERGINALPPDTPAMTWPLASRAAA